MRLYLVQHGEAKPKEEDAERPLTEQGRADETAAILAEHLEPGGGVIVWPGLAPKDDVTGVAELLNRGTQSLMIVGHRPFMDRLAGLLLVGDMDRTVVQFHQGGIVCLERDPEARTWSLVWAVTPELLP